MRPLPAALSIALLMTAPAATPALREQEPPSFPARSELVTVDVVVLGPDGKPVAGLTRDDFVVKEDGRPQAITAFEAVLAVLPGVESPQPAGASPSEAGVATNLAAPPTRRTFTLVFDDLHIGDLNIEQAKRAVQAFVDRETRPGDRVVLFTVSDARFWSTLHAANDPAFAAALRNVHSRRRLLDSLAARMSPVEAYRIEALGETAVADRVRRRRAILSGRCAWTGGRCMCDPIPGGAGAGAGAGGEGDGCLEPPGSSRPVEVYSLVRRDLDMTLRTLRAVTAALGRERDRKTVVLVSEGFILDPSVEGLKEVREEAARSNVSFYFLDARGLAVGPELLSAAGPSAGLPGQDLAATMFDWRSESAGPETLARETGGLVLQTNDLVAGLTQVAEESRVTYLLGYEPADEKRDGRYRKLKVEVRPPGLQVRARAGYFAAKGKPKPVAAPEPVARALRDLFDATGIPLRLATYVMGPALVKTPEEKTGSEVLIAGELRVDALEARGDGARQVAHPRLKLLTGGRGGESHESEWTLEVSLSSLSGRAEAELWHPFVTRLAMLAGEHRARLVVQSGERVGSVTVDFVVPPSTEERLSTPVLSDRLLTEASEGRVMPLARRTFPGSATLHAWIELLGARASAAGATQATAAFVARSADGTEWARGAATPMELGAGRPTRLVSLPLAQAPVGENELVFTVRDVLAERTFEAREPFRVTPPGGPGRVE